MIGRTFVVVNKCWRASACGDLYIPPFSKLFLTPLIPDAGKMCRKMKLFPLQTCYTSFKIWFTLLHEKFPGIPNYAMIDEWLLICRSLKWIWKNTSLICISLRNQMFRLDIYSTIYSEHSFNRELSGSNEILIIFWDSCGTERNYYGEWNYK